MAVIVMHSVNITGYVDYETTAGDTYDMLAFAAYNDEMKSSYIAQANRLHIDTLIFDAGVKIRIPVLDISDKPETLPPWRR